MTAAPTPPASFAFDALDSAVAAELLAVGSDVAITLDNKGSVVDVKLGLGEPAAIDPAEWIGRPLAQLVTPETRGKAEALLNEVSSRGIARRRQVNHPQRGGAPDLPVQYAAVRVEGGRRLVVVGRDLRPVSQLQQRLVAAQENMERDYWRLRHAETRYRHLFQLASEAILVLDAETRVVLDANRAASTLLALEGDALVGQRFPVGVSEGDHEALLALMASARASGRAEGARGTALLTGASFLASATCLRQESGTVMLLRLVGDESGAQPALSGLMERAPDAFVVTDTGGRILAANAAFLALADLKAAEEAVGAPLARWLGHDGADVPGFLRALEAAGVVRLAPSTTRGHHGATTEVEVSAVRSDDGEAPVIGWVIRDIGRRPPAGPAAVRDLSRAVEHLTHLVGQVPLRELVRDTIDLVERHFIAAALELTRDNRTSAAEVLGLSRQSLYVKLRRYQLLNSTDPDAGDDQP